MKYYFKTADYGESSVSIIDEQTLLKAEQGLNYLNPEEYSFLCEAEDMTEAQSYYWNVEFQSYVSGLMEA